MDAADIIMGYQIDKDIYLTLEQHELDALKIASKRTLDLQQFIDVADLVPRYFEKPTLKCRSGRPSRCENAPVRCRQPLVHAGGSTKDAAWQITSADLDSSPSRLETYFDFK